MKALTKYKLTEIQETAHGDLYINLSQKNVKTVN